MEERSGGGGSGGAEPGIGGRGGDAEARAPDGADGSASHPQAVGDAANDLADGGSGALAVPGSTPDPSALATLLGVAIILGARRRDA